MPGIKTTTGSFIFDAFFAKLSREENPAIRSRLLNKNMKELKTEEQIQKVQIFFLQHLQDSKDLRQHLEFIRQKDPKPEDKKDRKEKTVKRILSFQPNRA